MENSKVALAFCSLLFALPGAAQVTLKSDTPSLLFWTSEQQSTGYRSIEKIYQVATVKRGAHVHHQPEGRGWRRGRVRGVQHQPAWNLHIDGDERTHDRQHQHRHLGRRRGEARVHDAAG